LSAPNVLPDFIVRRAILNAATRPGPQKSSDQAIGRSRGGLSTKVHACVDALGNPVRLVLTAGQVADVTQGAALVKAIPTGAVIADNRNQRVLWCRSDYPASK